MKILASIVSIFLLAEVVLAAAFNTPAHLINVPIYKKFDTGDFTYGTSLAVSNLDDTEFDFMFNYAITDHLLIGLTMVNTTNFVGNFHCNFFNTERFWNWRAAGGIANISNNKTISTWNDHAEVQENSYSPYVVSSWTFYNFLYVHVGYGKKKFEAGFPGVIRENQIRGIIGGLELPLFGTRLMFEFDGKDYNTGVRFLMKPYGEFNFAFTEMLLDQGTNANYNNAPVKMFTLGFTYKKNVLDIKRDKLDEVEEELGAIRLLTRDLDQMKIKLEEELNHIRNEKELFSKDVVHLKNALKEDTRYIDEENKEKRDALRIHYLGVNQKLGEKVVTLYYQSFEAYYQKEYFRAIELLQKAIILDPYMPQLFIRLGSIYYELDMPNDAIQNWEKALMLDPHNQSLKDLLGSF